MTHDTKPINPLRRRMLEDMTLRKLSPKTQATYIRAVINFTRFIKRSPDTASAEDLRPLGAGILQPLTKVDLDIGRQGKALMVCQFFASVPGQ